VVELLLKSGADVDSKDTRFGRTPLSWAAETGLETIVYLLLEAGADVNLKDNSGRTPQSYLSNVFGDVDVLKKYQRKLMLLEEQNRQRLMMASQNQPRRIV
jgi:ankyrin repeat protein